jgi:hypothetical protein
MISFNPPLITGPTVVHHNIVVQGRVARAVPTDVVLDATEFNSTPSSYNKRTEPESCSKPRYAFMLNGRCFDARGVEIVPEPGKDVSETHTVISCSKSATTRYDGHPNPAQAVFKSSIQSRDCFSCACARHGSQFLYTPFHTQPLGIPYGGYTRY